MQAWYIAALEQGGRVDQFAKRGLLAGIAAIAIAAAALSLASPGRKNEAGSSLTVAVPAPVHDRIYSAPSARGRPIVVIDAGHGGRDPGATSVSGQVREKDLTLELARELRDELVRRGRVRIAMTREDDRYLTLDDRAVVADRLDAALFLSLHMDSAPNPLARGATVYSLSDVASDEEAARLAAAQNGDAASDVRRDTVQAVLSDLTTQWQMSASADLAARLVNRASGRIELRPEPHRFASFHVLRRAQAPAVLFESGYISNADDEVALRSPEQRAKIVRALAEAIEADVAAHSRH